MATYATKTWISSDVLTGALLNTHVRDPLDALQPSIYTLTTTDAANAGLIDITVPVNSGLLIWGWVQAVRSNYADGLHARFGGMYRRGAGSIALAGSYCVVAEDSASAPTVTMTTNGTATARVRINGVAAQTWLWKAVCMAQVLT